MPDFEKIQSELEIKGKDTNLEFPFKASYSAEDKVIEITLEEIPEIKFYLSNTEHEITCLTSLFHADEIRADKKSEINSVLLEINIFTHLAYIAKLDDLYLLKGTLPLSANSDDLSTLVQKMTMTYIGNIELIGEYLQEEEPEVRESKN